MLSSLCALFVLPTIWIVDASSGPGTNFTDLPAAVAAAASGDTILVRPGTYTSFQVSGKALTIRGAGLALTHVTGVTSSATRIDIPAGAKFVIDGLEFSPVNSPGLTEALRVTGVSGQLLISDSRVISAQFFPGMRGLLVQDATVVAVRCHFEGSSHSYFDYPLPGGPDNGVEMVGGTLIATDCRMVGGSMQSSHPRPGLVPGYGLFMSAGARATLHGCTAIGGGSNTGSANGSGVGVSCGSFRAAGRATDLLSGGQGGTQPNGLGVLNNCGTAVVHDQMTIIGG